MLRVFILLSLGVNEIEFPSTYLAVGDDGEVHLAQHGTDVAELGPASPARHGARPPHQVVVRVVL